MADPSEVLQLLVKGSNRPVDELVEKGLMTAREEIRKERKHRDAVEMAKATGVWPLARLEGASDRRRCACGMTWHMDEVPEHHNGLECQPPKDDEAVECDCGMTWPDGKPDPGHGDMYCRAEPCSTQFDAGPCAGIRGHAGDCTPNADDIPVQ
jgi:hypothetical protein